ncbi:hypothetical protein N9I24_04815 [Gammaproteobacteria bacterium]|jgi:hypothetical protein|nr:hypothetical protein [Gammaproteobacteria bacterium]
MEKFLMLRLNTYATGLLLIVLAAPVALIVEDLSSISLIPTLFYGVALLFFARLFYVSGYVAVIPFITLVSTFLYAVLISFFVGINVFNLIELAFLLSFLYAFYLKKNIDINHFKIRCYFVGLIYAAYVFFSTLYIDSTINYLRFTYFLPIVIVIAGVYAANKKRIILNSIILGLCTLLLMQFMGRYPIIFSFFAVLTYFAATSKHTVIFFIGLLAIISIYATQIIELFSSMSWFIRTMYWEDGLDNSRLTLYTEYLSKFHEFYLTGYGVGNTDVKLYDYVGQYPHNLFAHAVSDLGIFGLLLCIILLSQFISAFISFIKARKILVAMKDKDSLISLDSIFLIFLYVLFLFNKSGSFYDIYPLIAITIVLKKGSSAISKHAIKWS